MKTVILLLAFLLSTKLFSQVHETNLSGTDYFRLMNYTDPSTHTEIFKFEAQIDKLSSDILKYTEVNPNYIPYRRETSLNKLGMILVYTSMFIMNNNNGFIEGRINIEKFPGDKNNARELIIKRYKRAELLLEKAMTLSSDSRIPSWYFANVFRRQKFEQGFVDASVVDKIVELAIEDPIFHLFNALTMNSDYSFKSEQEDELFEKVKLLSSKDSPCWPPIKFLRTGVAKKCNTTNKTPFAFQGVSTYMGDTFLKQALKLKVSEPERSAEYLKKAEGLYRQINWLFFKPKFRKWGMKDLVVRRLELVEGYKQTGNFPKSFFQSKEYTDIYTCQSCHQKGQAKSSLTVNLP